MAVLALHMWAVGNYPVVLMEDSGSGARTLAETVVRARCQSSGDRTLEIFLVADGAARWSVEGRLY